MKKPHHGDHTTTILVAMLLVGLLLLLYPGVSNYWNSLHSTQAIATYAENVANLNAELYDRLWQDATNYNKSLAARPGNYFLTEAQQQQYNDLLNISGIGIMGYIEIPSIEVSLPIYHGIEESVLQVAVGHIEWSSLPVGGAGTHCVMSGHRGLPSAKLFTNLDKLVEGDIFMLRVLDEVLTYEVDQILIVEPKEVDSLQIIDGQDLCTLVTCTPYGINSHRLLVRGHRIENIDDGSSVRVVADAIQIEPLLVAPLLATPVLLVLLVILLLPKKSTKSTKGDYYEIS